MSREDWEWTEALKEDRKERRRANRERNDEWLAELERAGLVAVVRLDPAGHHCRVAATKGGRTADYWPASGVVMYRGRKLGNGRGALLRALGLEDP